MNYGALAAFVYVLIGLWIFLAMYGALMDHIKLRMSIAPVSNARAAFGMTAVSIIVTLGWPVFCAVAYYLARNKEHE